MKKLLGAFAVVALLSTTAIAQDNAAAQETKEGSQSPEGGAWGAGADVHESEAHGIENWWDLGYKKKNLPPPFGFALINFAVFLAIMSKLAWKPLKKYVADRHDGIAKNLKEAAELRAAAEATLKQYEEKIKGIDREVDTLLAQIRKEAEGEKARIMAAAEADAKRLKADAERQIAAEIDRARRELRRGVIEAAVAAAQQSLQKNIAPDDQRKMAEKYVADVERTAKAGRPS
jgi:F-type H+-transporting ATPase subunit b